MSAEQNVELMRRWFREVWNEGRRQTIFDLMAADGIGHGQLEDGGELRGPAEFAELFGRCVAPFPT